MSDREPEADELPNDGSMQAAMMALSDEDVGLPPADKASRTRAADGKFAKTEVPATEKPVPQVEPEKTTDPADPAKAAAEDEGDYVEWEETGDDGKPLTKREKLEVLLESRTRAEQLAHELETVKKVAPPPVEWSEALTQVMQEREKLASGLMELDAYYGQAKPPSIELLNPASQTCDPATYFQQHQSFEHAQKMREAARAQLRQIGDQHKADMEKQFAASQLKAKAHLDKFWPELNTRDGAQKFLKDMGEAYGFKAEELQSPLPTHYYAVLKDALAYRAQQAKAAEAIKIVRAKPRLVSASARPSSNPKAAKVDNAMGRLMKTGAMADAMDALDGLLN